MEITKTNIISVLTVSMGYHRCPWAKKNILLAWSHHLPAPDQQSTLVLYPSPLNCLKVFVLWSLIVQKSRYMYAPTSFLGLKKIDRRGTRIDKANIWGFIEGHVTVSQAAIDGLVFLRLYFFGRSSGHWSLWIRQSHQKNDLLWINSTELFIQKGLWKWRNCCV